MNRSSQRRFPKKLKPILIGALTAIAVGLASAIVRSLHLQELWHTSLVWVKSLGILGPIAFIAIYNLATLLFVPGSILTIKGGCLFGLLYGSIYVSIAALLGATGAFLLGRYLSRDWVCRQMEKHPTFLALDRAVAREGWKIVLLARLSPLFPFNLLNYAFGVTKISLKDYILGSLGMIPCTVVYVYIGSLASDLAMNDPAATTTPTEARVLQWALRIIGLLATVAITIYLTRIARKALDQSLLEEKIPHVTQEKP